MLGFGSHSVTMSGNPLHSFGASDSGILDGFSGLIAGKSRGDGAHAPLHGPMFTNDDSDSGSQSDADVERQLRDVRVPDGFVQRMLKRFEDET